MRRAFTLIEVLCVLAIVGILAALLLPVLSTARSQARRTSCISQLKQIGLGTAIYRQDWNALPQHLTQLYPVAVNDARVFVCPNDPNDGLQAGNDYFEGDHYLASGVSYEYFPRWILPETKGFPWYDPAPNLGDGKWDDLTPFVGCPWHWAKTFGIERTETDEKATGWELILTLGGSVRKTRIEQPISTFNPTKYQ